jgi:hypothetical protein
LLPNRKELTLLLLAIPLRVVKKAVIMYFYKFHIGDYMSHTRHLSHYEDLAYRRLLDFYFLHEQPIKHRDAARHIGMKDREEDVLTVLNEFFISTENGFVNAYADKQIADFHKHQAVSAFGAFIRDNPSLKVIVNKEDFVLHYLAQSIDVYIGTLRGNDVPIISTQSVDDAPLTTNQKPLTTNHKPIKENKKGSRLSQDWFLTKSLGDWATQERPDLDVRQVAEQFKDYWIAQPGQKGVKLDWDATWRNWVRNTKAVKSNPADIVRLTVPSNEPDAALLKIKEDDKKAAPIPLEVLAKMAELRRKA